MQTGVLDRGPDNGKATHLRRKHINLIGALPNIAKQTFDGVGGLNMPMMHFQKLIPIMKPAYTLLWLLS